MKRLFVLARSWRCWRLLCCCPAECRPKGPSCAQCCSTRLPARTATYVMTEVLPPLIEKYGDQLQIAAIDVTNASGQALYQSAVDKYGITEERLGVPALVVGTTVLVGSSEIPEQFPGILRAALAKGGEELARNSRPSRCAGAHRRPYVGPAEAPAAAGRSTGGSTGVRPLSLRRIRPPRSPPSRRTGRSPTS